MAALREWLAHNPSRYVITGPPRCMGYHSPFGPWSLRIGGAQLPVKPR